MGKMYHLDVGCADASIIENDGGHFLVDTHGIEDFAHLLPANKKLRGVFVTHQHYDHFDGLRYLRDHGYTIDCLIYSPYERRYGDNSVDIDEWNEFVSLKDYFVRKGANEYKPYRQDSFEKPFWATNGLRIWMIGPHKSVATSDTRELHDACLVLKVDFLASQRKCLFTGDASDANLNKISATTTHFCDDILHASHHGSINGADLDFVKGCNADYCVISTKSGVHDNVPHSTAIARYNANTKKKVYRTDVDKTLTWTV